MMCRLIAVSLTSLVWLTACPGEALFPKCDDPEKPCPNVEPTYPSGDRDGLDTPIGRLCNQLRVAGCGEGFLSSRSKRTCFESYTAASKFANVPVNCILAATTQSEIRACGGPSDIRVRCIMPSAEVEGSYAP